MFLAKGESVEWEDVEGRACEALRDILTQEHFINEQRAEVVNNITHELRKRGLTFTPHTLDARETGITLKYDKDKRRHPLRSISMWGTFKNVPFNKGFRLNIIVETHDATSPLVQSIRITRN